jgi:VanZ family protein
MSVIFATSCTVISSKQWVRIATTSGPVHIRPDRFQGFWESWWWLFVKGYHVLEFALLTLLLLRPLKGRLLQVAALALTFAASDEYHQTFVPGRGGKWTDVAIDSIGIILICLIVWVLKLGARQPASPLPA